MNWYLDVTRDHGPTATYVAKLFTGRILEWKPTQCADGQERWLLICSEGHDDVNQVLMAIKEFGYKLQVYRQCVEGGIYRYYHDREPGCIRRLATNARRCHRELCR